MGATDESGKERASGMPPQPGSSVASAPEALPGGDSNATRDPSPASDASLTPPPEQWPVLPGYEILAELGHGGMGRVFKALQLRLNRLVALKIIRPEWLANSQAIRRFQREARAAARLSHANIVAVFDADQAEGVYFLAMEYVEGTDLARLVRNQGPLAIAQACDYIRQASLGLQHAQERGLVHRDIKPSNLLLAVPAGVIKILDLGLARLLPGGFSDGVSSELTESGVIMGTPDYVAPEQASDPRRADIRSDIYSLGGTFYYLLTGQPPFPGGTGLDKLVKHTSQEPLPVRARRPEVPAELQLVIQRMMAKQPELRYQTPAQVAEALRPFCEGSFSASALPCSTSNLTTVPDRPEPVLHPADPSQKSEPPRLPPWEKGTGSPAIHRPPPRGTPSVPSRTRIVGWVVGLIVAGLLIGLGIPYVIPKKQPPPMIGTVPSPDIPPEPRVAAEDLANYQRLLANDPQQALERFSEALKVIRQMKNAPAGLHSQALLGQARAYACLKQWDRAREALADLPADPKVRVHRQVVEVLALGDHADEKGFDLPACLDAVARVQDIDVSRSFDGWDTEQMQALRARIAQAALEAARRVRLPFDPRVPFEPRYRSQDAQQVYPWLQKAYSLLSGAFDPVPQELRKELVLVASAMRPRPTVDAARLLHDLHSDARPENAPYLLLKAQAQPDNLVGNRTAFDTYESLAKLIGDRASVLEEALAAGERIRSQRDEPGIKKRLAALYLAKARLFGEQSNTGVTACESAVALNPDPAALTALSRHCRGFAMRLQGPERKRYLDKALEAAGQALSHPEKPASAFDAKGLALLDIARFDDNQDKFQEGVVAFTDAINSSLEPRYALHRGQCYYYWAVASKNQARFSSAAKDLQTALASNLPTEDQIEAHYLLARVLHETGKQALAIAHLDDALRLTPEPRRKAEIEMLKRKWRDEMPH